MPDRKREFAAAVVRRLREAGFQALWAGGCVRDLLLDLEPDDYDVATNAVPDQVRQTFGKRQTLAIGEAFGVILVKGGVGGDVEVATFRAEGPYVDGRRPEHVVFCTPEEDAHRRDFTINGMFYDPVDEQVLDYVGGQADLQTGIVRAIGEPRARFTEDKLRLLRAIRMTARFGFQLDAATAAAVREMASEILVVSQERIAQELKKMLVHHRRAMATQLAADLGVLPVILPELTPLCDSRGDSWDKLLRRLELLNSHSQISNLKSQIPFELPMAILLGDSAAGTIDACCRRLKLSNKELEAIQWLVQHRESLDDAQGLPLSRLKPLLAHPLVRDLLVLARVNAIAESRDPSGVEFAVDFLIRTAPEELTPPPLVTGGDLKAAGLHPGPEFKQILDSVRERQLDGNLANREDAIAWVRNAIETGRRGT